MHTLIIFCATYLIFLPVAVIAYVEFRSLRNRKYDVLAISLLVLAVGFLLAHIASTLVADPRPFVYGHMKALVTSGMDNGFPSDHTLVSSMLAVIGWHYSRKLGIALGIVAAIVGWGRVAAHVHHLEDVLAAMVIAIVSYFIALWAYKLVRTYRSSTTVTN